MVHTANVTPRSTARGTTASRSERETVAYVCDLAKKNSEALSFIPTPRLELYAQRRQIILAHENNEPCGFIVHGNGWPQMRVYQACVQYDARRREHGLSMVEELVVRAERAGCSDVRLWCADDLEANAFWREALFAPYAQRAGGLRRGRTHTLWARRLNTPNLFCDGDAKQSSTANTSATTI